MNTVPVYCIWTGKSVYNLKKVLKKKTVNIYKYCYKNITKYLLIYNAKSSYKSLF